MTSIITDDYKKNLLRLYANGEGKDKEAGSIQEKGKTFQSLLTNAESENKKAATITLAKEANIQENPPTFIGDALTNENSTSEHLKFVVPTPTTQAGIIGDMPLEEDVQSPEVLFINTQTISEEEPTEKPSMPQVISSRRISSENFVKLTPNDLQIDKVKEMIISAGNYHGVDPSLGLAIARVESSFNPKAVSQDGFASKGIFQLLDSTGKNIHESTGLTEPYKPFDPSMNTFLGVGHFRRLLDLFSKETTLTGSLKTYPAQSADDLEKLAVAAFNAGEGNVARAQAKAMQSGKDPAAFENIRQYLPDITKSYVDKVSSLRNQFAENVLSTNLG